jgi:hypothetical protein
LDDLHFEESTTFDPTIVEEGRIMKENQAKEMQPSEANKSTVTDQSAGNARPALPPAHNHPACDPNCADVTGIVPEGIRIDPDITEGHPGYEESGDSEIIPVDRLAGGEEKKG